MQKAMWFRIRNINIKFIIWSFTANEGKELVTHKGYYTSSEFNSENVSNAVFGLIEHYNRLKDFCKTKSKEKNEPP